MKWTLLLILANIAVFIYTLPSPDYYISNFGFSEQAFLSGKYYLPITAMFVHAGLLHIVGNMVALLALGAAVESKVSTKKFFGAYFLAGLAGMLSPVIPFFGYDAATIFVGASGAISGLVGLGIFTCPGKFVWFPEIVPLPFALAGAIFLMTTISGVLTPSDVADSGHLLGLMVGAILGFLWTKDRLKNLLAFAIVFAIVLFFPLLLTMFNTYFGVNLRF